MTTRFELVIPGDPLLKNELLEGAKGAMFAKGTVAERLRRAIAFLFRLKNEDEKWKDTGTYYARQAIARGHGPVQTPCTVTWTHLRKNAGRVDTAAIAMPTWSLLDGIVRGGMLPDDDKRYVIGQCYDVDERAGREGIRVLIETVPGAPIQDHILDTAASSSISPADIELVREATEFASSAAAELPARQELLP